MSDLYKLGQSQEGDLSQVGQEIRLDVDLSENPYLNTGSITGTITDPDGNPVSGVLIKILDNNNNPLYHTLTDDNGKYNIIDVEPSSELRFSMIKKGYLLNNTTSFSITAGQTITIDATITPNPDAQLGTITTHIFDESGNPLEGVTATLLQEEGGEEIPIAVTITNEFGQCAFTNIPIGSYIGRATKQGYIPAILEIILTEPGSIVNVVGTLITSPTTSQGTINGIIKDDEGRAVIGATVILYEVTGDPDNPTLTPIKYTRTIEGGTYLFGDIPQGKYIVKANKEQ